ncbi:MAG: outer membrane beta-barrel protein [Candidatus Methylacidiphilales bacterium]|nr:outer membrane beta-barrel protein [Candidatus Methylacidiphilales bacterium]
MRRPILSLLAVAALFSSLPSSSVLAGDSKAVATSDPKISKALAKAIDDQTIYVETAKPGIRLSGYVEASYTNQFASSGENGLGSTEDGLKGDFTHNDFNINAIKLVIEKDLSDDRSAWSVGFRTDIFFGEDALSFAPNDPAVGTSDLYLQQVFIKLRIPVGRGLDVSVGKTVGFIGYEADERPANMNYSYGLVNVALQNGNATGIQLGYPLTDHIQLNLNVSNGWDGSDVGPYANGALRNGAVTVCGQVVFSAPGGNAYIAPTFMVCTQGAPVLASVGMRENEPLVFGNLYGQWQPECIPNKRLTLAFDSVAAFASSGTDDLLATPGAPVDDNTNWWGIALFSKYQFTSIFSLAVRAEYIHNDDGAKFLNNSVPGNNAAFAAFPNGSSADAWSGTLTAGFDIWENVSTRIEYRYDRGPDDLIGGSDQHQIAVDVSYSF